jgi:predicted permease
MSEVMQTIETWLADPVARKLIAYTTLIIGSFSIGYGCRKAHLLGETVSRWIMTIVSVFGYATLQLFALWGLRLSAEMIWLPILGGLNILLMCLIGMAGGRALFKDKGERGLFAISSGLCNTGITMGGLVLLAFYGMEGLGRMSLYCIMWTPVVIGMLYPMCRHYSDHFAGGSLGRLMFRSVFDWRSVGLPVAVAGIVLSLTLGPERRPAWVANWRIIDIIAYGTNAAAYFAIGLRTSLRHTRHIGRLIGAAAVMRFTVSAGVAAVLVFITTRFVTMDAMNVNVIMIESVMPVAVTMVAGANMFRMNTQAASTLFVINTFMFLAIMLPILFVIFQVLGVNSVS